MYDLSNGSGFSDHELPLTYISSHGVIFSSIDSINVLCAQLTRDLFAIVKFLFKLSSNQTKGHDFKLYKQFSSSTVRSSFFAQRVVNVWNSLPSSVDLSTLSAFKKSLQRVNLNEFLTAYKSFDVHDCV